MGYTVKHDKELTQQEIADWIYKTPVDVLADHAVNGIDLDDPPRELVFPRPPPPGAQGGSGLLSARRLRELEQTVADLTRPPTAPENREVKE